MKKKIYPIQKLLNDKGYLIADGATGTELIKLNLLKKGKSPEALMLEAPEHFVKIHSSYYQAGSDYVVANSFGATRTKLSQIGLEKDFEKINLMAVDCVRKAVKGHKAFIAASIGPSGKLLPPFGESCMEDLIAIYSEQIRLLFNEGVELFVIETMTDIREAKSAYIAIRDVCDIPVGVCLSFEPGGRTIANNTPEAFAVSFDASDVMFLGANCSIGPVDITPVMQRMGEYAQKAMIANPNAGVLDKSFSKEDFLSQMDDWVASGCRVFGACCGSNPEYIKAMVEKLSTMKIVKKLEYKYATHLSSTSKVVSFGEGFPTAIIAEGINPSNKKQMTEELRQGKLNTVLNTARLQFEHGADLLDVNLGASNVDQKKLMAEAFEKLSVVVDMPLVVDAADTEVIESALRSYGAKALINSTTADEEKAEEIFKLSAKYGAAVIGLTMDAKGIAMDAGKRLKLAEKLLKMAEKHGVKKQDLIIDTLTLSLSSNQKDVLISIDALKMLREKLGLSTVLGVSNVSYGLPQRQILNQAFLTVAVYEGLNAAIINPGVKELSNAIDAMRLIKGYDTNSLEYLRKHGTKDQKTCRSQDELVQAIIDGDEKKALICLDKALKDKPFVDINKLQILPAIDIVGRYFKEGKYFLPQVLMSAQVVKACFDQVRKNVVDSKKNYKAKIIMATVEGDIHDIGKNIVCMLLESSGFEVLDLGKSVSSSEIVSKAKEIKPDIIGLSALMTTTMDEMAVVVEDLRKNKLDIPVIIGGAVVTQHFADSIGARYYAKDAMQAVELLNSTHGKTKK